MRRLLLNGSPRGEASNTRTILSWTAEGLASAGAPEPLLLNLTGPEGAEKAAAAFLESDEVVLAFPLYTDSMPGITAAFTNALAGADPARLAGKRVGFIVHSGFPESVHSEVLASYLRRMSARLGLICLGVAVKGGSEGFRLNPRSGTSRTAERFRTLGRRLAETGGFDPETLEALARPRVLGPGAVIALRLLAPTGLANLYWNIMLRKHGAYARRFDRPYAPV